MHIVSPDHAGGQANSPPTLATINAARVMSGADIAPGACCKQERGVLLDFIARLRKQGRRWLVLFLSSLSTPLTRCKHDFIGGFLARFFEPSCAKSFSLLRGQRWRCHFINERWTQIHSGEVVG